MTEEGIGRVRGAYEVHYDRLSDIKLRYDPDNLFSMNQNIRICLADTSVDGGSLRTLTWAGSLRYTDFVAVGGRFSR